MLLWFSELYRNIFASHHLSQEYDQEVVKALLAHKSIDVNKARTSYGVTALFMAAQDGNKGVV